VSEPVDVGSALLAWPIAFLIARHYGVLAGMLNVTEDAPQWVQWIYGRGG
jgi:hypothetical protein